MQDERLSVTYIQKDAVILWDIINLTKYFLT